MINRYIRLFLAVLVILTIIVGISVAGTIFYVGGDVYQPDGSFGTPTTPNSCGTTFIFRNNVSAHSGYTVYNDSYYPSDGSAPAYYFKDTSSDWDGSSTRAIGDFIKAIVEVRNGVNDYTGISYVGAASGTITGVDIGNSSIYLGDILIQAIPTPEMSSITSNSIAISWEGIDTSYTSVETYVICRSTQEAGTYTEVGTKAHSTGVSTFEDTTVSAGQTYYYKLRLRYAWTANTPAYYTTSAESNASQAILSTPSISGVSPNSGSVSSTTTSLTIEGNNFVGVSAVWLQKTGETPIQASSFSGSSLTTIESVDFNLSNVDVIGPWDVMVVTSLGACTGEGLFTITSEAPVISNWDPKSDTASNPSRTIDITGSKLFKGITAKLTSGSVTINAAPTTWVSTANIRPVFDLSSAPTLGAYSLIITNTDLKTSTETFTITSEAPLITSITPATGINTGSVFTTIEGTGFFSGEVIQLRKSGENSIDATEIRRLSSTEVDCTFDITGKAMGLWNVFLRNTDSQSTTETGAFLVTANEPTLISITPTSDSASKSSSNVRIIGTNFYSGATVKLQRTGQTTIDGTGVILTGFTTIDCTFNLTGAATLGAWDVVVTNTDAGSVTGTNLFTITSEAPVITSISPAAISTSANTLNATINGANFYSGAIAKLKRSGQSDIAGTSVTRVNSTQLTCSFDLSSVATLGAWDVYVQNTDSQSSTESGALLITTEAPSISGITPSSGSNTGTVSITDLAGSRFFGGATVRLEKSGQPTIDGSSVSVVSRTRITCDFDINGAEIGAWNIVVTNTDGQSYTKSPGFTVQTAAPTVSTITPTSDSTSKSSSNVRIIGTNFYSGATVKLQRTGQTTIDGTGVSLTGSTTIDCTFNLTGAATLGAWNVVVTNTDAQSGTNLFTITSEAPVITNIIPSSALSGASRNIIINGLRFYGGLTVKLQKTGQPTIDGTSVIVRDTGSVECTLDLSSVATLGAWTVMVINTDSKSSTEAFTITSANPTIESIAPLSCLNVGSVNMTITGQRFYNGATVKLVKGSSVINAVVNSQNSTTINCDINVDSVDAGSWGVLVTNTDGGYYTYEALTIQSQQGGAINSIVPDIAFNRDANFSAIINGTNLPVPAQLYIQNGTKTYNATYKNRISSTTIEARFDLTSPDRAPISPIGTKSWGVYLENASGEGIFKGSLLTITSEAPIITGIDPSSGGNSGTVHITDLAGSDFYPSAVVQLRKSGQASIDAANITVSSSSKITCDFNLNGAEKGSWDVYLQNTDGQNTTEAGGFNVTATVLDPSNCSIEVLSTTSVRITWVNNAVSATANRIEKSTDDITYSEVGTAGPSTEKYTGSGTTGLAVNSRYWFRVRAEASGVFSGYATADAKYTLSEKPSAEGFTNINSSGFKANWDANGNPAGTNYICEIITTATSVSTTDTSYNFTGLSSATTYVISVESMNEDDINSIWVGLGTVSTTPIMKIPDMFESGTRLFSGDIIRAKSRFNVTLPSSTIDPATYRMYIDGTEVSDGTMGRYDSFTEAGGIATFEYEVKIPLIEGTHVARVTVQDYPGNIYDDERTGLRVMTSSGVVGYTVVSPNPYNPVAGDMKITYNLATDASVTIYMFDVNGRLVWKNNYSIGTNGGKAGYNEVLWNGINAFGSIVKNDLYLIRIVESGTGRLLGKAKMMLLRGVSTKENKEAPKTASKNATGDIAMLALLFVGIALYGGSMKVYKTIRKMRNK